MSSFATNFWFNPWLRDGCINPSPHYRKASLLKRDISVDIGVSLQRPLWINSEEVKNKSTSTNLRIKDHFKIKRSITSFSIRILHMSTNLQSPRIENKTTMKRRIEELHHIVKALLLHKSILLVCLVDKYKALLWSTTHFY